MPQTKTLTILFCQGPLRDLRFHWRRRREQRLSRQLLPPLSNMVTSQKGPASMSGWSLFLPDRFGWDLLTEKEEWTSVPVTRST